MFDSIGDDFLGAGSTNALREVSSTDAPPVQRTQKKWSQTVVLVNSKLSSPLKRGDDRPKAHKNAFSVGDPPRTPL